MENKYKFGIILTIVISLCISFVFNSIRWVWKTTENENTTLKITSDSEKVCEMFDGHKITNNVGAYLGCEK